MGNIIRYVEYNEKNTLKSFLKSMIQSQLFKILPMKEEENKYLCDYLDSLFFELLGGLYVFEELGKHVEYIRILNTVSFLREETFDAKQCKREVFKMISLAKKIYLDITGEKYER